MNNKILLADDEKDVVQIIEKRLIKNGFDVYPAFDGQEAYDLTVRNIPDLIVTDVAMPAMSGFEFCKAVRNNAHTKDIPIIVLSAKVNMEDSFMFLGIKDFIHKPFNLDQLEDKIKDRLSLSQYTRKTKIIFHCVKPDSLHTARRLIESVPQWASSFVTTGADLIKMAQEIRPDVIVADLFMYDMPVEEALAHLRHIPELSNTEILTYYSPISGASDSLTMQAKMIEVQYLKRVSSEAGAKEYLGPFNPDNFLGLFNEYRKDKRE